MHDGRPGRLLEHVADVRDVGDRHRLESAGTVAHRGVMGGDLRRHLTNLAFNPRILVLFGNVPLLGNERANIETIDQLRQKGADVRFLIRKEWTSESIQAELMRRGLAFEFVPYFDAIRYSAGVGSWIKNVHGILGGSAALLRQIWSFKATHLHVGSTAWVLNFLPRSWLHGYRWFFELEKCLPITTVFGGGSGASHVVARRLSSAICNS